MFKVAFQVYLDFTNIKNRRIKFKNFTWGSPRRFQFSWRSNDGPKGADLTPFDDLLDQDLTLVAEQVPTEQQVTRVSEKSQNLKIEMFLLNVRLWGHISVFDSDYGVLGIVCRCHETGLTLVLVLFNVNTLNNIR